MEKGEDKTVEEKDPKDFREKPVDLEEVISVYEKRLTKRGRKRRAKKDSKKSGYFISILVGVCLIFVFDHWQEWHFPFLNKDFGLILPILTLSLGASIFGNFLLLFYNEGKFKSFVYMLLDFLVLLSLYNLYKVFPFELPLLPALNINLGMRIALLGGMMIAGVAGMIEFFKIVFNTEDWR